MSNVRVLNGIGEHPAYLIEEARTMVDLLGSQIRHASSRPMLKDSLKAHQETIRAHYPIRQTHVCRCGNLLPCADYVRVRKMLQGWGVMA